MANLDSVKRASAVALQKDPVAREVRAAAGSIYAPPKLWTAQTIEEYLVRFDLLRGKAESRMQVEGLAPRNICPDLAWEECISISH